MSALNRKTLNARCSSPAGTADAGDAAANGPLLARLPARGPAPEGLAAASASCRPARPPPAGPRRRGGTFLDVLVQVTVLLGVRPDAGVVLVDEDAHLRQELHLLRVEAAGVHLGHRCGGAGPSREAAGEAVRARRRTGGGCASPARRLTPLPSRRPASPRRSRRRRRPRRPALRTSGVGRRSAPAPPRTLQL